MACALLNGIEKRSHKQEREEAGFETRADR